MMTANGHVDPRGSVAPPIIMRTAATPMPTPKGSLGPDSILGEELVGTNPFGEAGLGFSESGSGSRRGSSASMDPSAYDQYSLVSSVLHHTGKTVTHINVVIFFSPRASLVLADAPLFLPVGREVPGEVAAPAGTAWEERPASRDETPVERGRVCYLEKGQKKKRWWGSRGRIVGATGYDPAPLRCCRRPHSCRPSWLSTATVTEGP